MEESDFKPDDAVIVVSGAFKGFRGVVIGYDETVPSRLKIDVIDDFGRLASALVEVGDLERR